MPIFQKFFRFFRKIFEKVIDKPTQKKKREKVSRFLELLFFFYNADMHVV